MNIIIEGPDATGKTTLANKLVEKYKMKYTHLTSKTENDMRFHLYLLATDNNVYDRFFMGELVYPQIYNRPAKMTFNECCTVMNKIIENNDLFIILYSSELNVLNQRLIDRGEIDYLKEIEQQNNLFIAAGNAFYEYEYENFKMFDISKPGVYEKIDKWIASKMPNMNSIYKDICKDLTIKGHKVGNTTEINNYTFTLDNVDENIVTLKSRDISLIYLVAELLWYFEGRNDVDFIGKFASMWNRISDDGVTNNSAYGYILKYKHGFDQIEKIIELLQKDPNTRRAVLNINVPNEKVIETKDEMCTIALNLYIRDGKLNCTGMMRSNDVWFGLTYDIVYFTELQKYIASRLGIKAGSYTHFATSMHYYDRDKERIFNVVNNGLDTIENTIDINKLIENKDELINYIDTTFTSKEDFEVKIKKLGVIKKG